MNGHPTMSAAELVRHDLEQVVPAMESGFVIHTRRGVVQLDAGDVRRERELVRAVENILKYRLYLAERDERAGSAA